MRLPRRPPPQLPTPAEIKVVVVQKAGRGGEPSQSHQRPGEGLFQRCDTQQQAVYLHRKEAAVTAARSRVSGVNIMCKQGVNHVGLRLAGSISSALQPLILIIAYRWRRMVII